MIVSRSLLMFALGVALLLAACGHTPPLSLYKLSRFDPHTADLGALRAAVRLPEMLRPRSVTLVIAAKSWAEAVPRQEKFVLEADASPQEIDALKDEREPGTKLHVYRFAASDLARAEHFRGDIAAFRVAGGDTVSVEADACRSAPFGAGPLFFTSFLKLEPEGDYIPIARDVDLASYVKDGNLAAKLPECSKR